MHPSDVDAEFADELCLWYWLVCLLEPGTAEMNQGTEPSVLGSPPDDPSVSSEAQSGFVGNIGTPVFFRVNLRHRNQTDDLRPLRLASADASLPLDDDDEAARAPLSVYMACLSLDTCRMSDQHCHLEGSYRCGEGAPAPCSSSSRAQRSGSSDDYTLVLKPKALKPCGVGVTVGSVAEAERPGSTPSRILSPPEDETRRSAYSSPNSPVAFSAGMSTPERAASPACANCKRSRSATVESEQKQQQRRGKKKKENASEKRASRCSSEEFDDDDDRSTTPRYSLRSCLGSRHQGGQGGSSPRGSGKRRFSFTLPSALLSVFRRGGPPTRNSASQTEPYLEEVHCSEKATSPYAVRALPPLPGSVGSAPDSDSEDRKSVDYAASIEKVKDYGWYWGPISGETAERLLANEPDGSFVVRDSSDEHYIFSLTFKLHGLVRHVRIEHDQGNFSFGCLQKFHSHTIVDFIENAVEHSRSGRYLFFLHRRPILGPMRVQLLHPVSRFKQVQSLQHLCRFSILKSVRRDLIESLPLPARLRAYLNTPHYYSEELAADANPHGALGSIAFASHPFPVVQGHTPETLFRES